MKVSEDTVWARHRFKPPGDLREGGAIERGSTVVYFAGEAIEKRYDWARDEITPG